MGKLAIARTVIPIEYDRSTEGFNAWSLMIKNRLHINQHPITISSIVSETYKVLKFHTPSKK